MNQILEKTELLDVCRAELNKRGIPFIHIPNSIFIRATWSVINMFRYFPDILFLYEGKVYMREFGIGNRNKQPKMKQWSFMQTWIRSGADGKIITTQGELLRDFQEIGIF